MSHKPFLVTLIAFCLVAFAHCLWVKDLGNGLAALAIGIMSSLFVGVREK